LYDRERQRNYTDHFSDTWNTPCDRFCFGRYNFCFAGAFRCGFDSRGDTLIDPVGEITRF
jgi:hypothetical protein